MAEWIDANEPDDLTRLLAEVEGDPVAKAAFDDAEARRELLIELIGARGRMRQATVADAMGTTQSAISDLERGRVDPRLSTLQRYARAVNRRLDIDLALDLTSSTLGEAVDSAIEVATDVGLARVLSTLFREQKLSGPQTRSALVHLTGLPEVTVDLMVSRLEETGWVSSSSGAPADGTRFTLLRDRGLVIGVSLTRGLVKAVLTDLSARKVFDTRGASLSSSTPDYVVATVARLVDELQAYCKGLGPSHDVVGLGVTLAGRVDGVTGAVYFAPDFDSAGMAWRQVPLEAMLQEQTELRTAVENDANALAIHGFLSQVDKSPLAVILMGRSGQGIGAGLVINGETAHGFEGIGGEIGHLVLDPAGEPCRCRKDARGCLETIASPMAILRRSAGAEGAPTSLGDLARLVDAGDSTAITAVKEAGAAFAQIIAYMVAIVGPQRIILLGPRELVSTGTASGNLLVNEAGRAVEAFPVKVEIEAKVLDELDEAKAAAAAAVRHFLSRPRRWVPDLAVDPRDWASAPAAARLRKARA